MDEFLDNELESNEEGYRVRIGKLPGTIKEIEMKGACTIADVISQADLNPDGYEIRLNGNPSNLNAIVKEQDTILLVRKIRGNILN